MVTDVGQGVGMSDEAIWCGQFTDNWLRLP
jgi:hypothetical protein